MLRPLCNFRDLGTQRRLRLRLRHLRHMIRHVSFCPGAGSPPVPHPSPERGWRRMRQRSVRDSHMSLDLDRSRYQKHRCPPLQARGRLHGEPDQRRRARCVPDGSVRRGPSRALTGMMDNRQPADKPVRARPALIPKLIVRPCRAVGPTACHIRATPRRNQGALTATHTQSEESMTREHAGCSRQ